MRVPMFLRHTDFYGLRVLVEPVRVRSQAHKQGREKMYQDYGMDTAQYYLTDDLIHVYVYIYIKQ